MKNWKYSVGRIDEHMIRDHLFAPSQDSLALICGPAPFVEACLNNLRKFGYDDQCMFEF
jgi:NAD(P)H-flavin reductase